MCSKQKEKDLVASTAPGRQPSSPPSRTRPRSCSGGACCGLPDLRRYAPRGGRAAQASGAAGGVGLGGRPPAQHLLRGRRLPQAPDAGLGALPGPPRVPERTGRARLGPGSRAGPPAACEACAARCSTTTPNPATCWSRLPRRPSSESCSRASTWKDVLTCPAPGQGAHPRDLERPRIRTPRRPPVLL